VRPEIQHIPLGVSPDLGQVLDQDAYNLPGVQKGMQSDGFPGLWLGSQELRIRHFHQVLQSYIERGLAEEKSS
jgi:hypothetical protein